MVDYCFTHLIYTCLLVGNVISFSVLVAVVSWDDGPQQKTWQFPEFRPSCGQRNKIHTQAVYMIQPTMLNNMCIHHTWHALYMIYVIYIYWNINYTILYYVILYYIKLYYIVLYCIILYCKILCYVILWCVLFCYVISYYIMLYYLMFEYMIWC